MHVRLLFPFNPPFFHEKTSLTLLSLNLPPTVPPLQMIAEERVRAENALFQQRLTLRNELNQREGQFKVKLDGELNELRLQIEAENASKMRRIETELERRMAEERTRYERDLYNARAAAREEISLMKGRAAGSYCACYNKSSPLPR